MSGDGTSKQPNASDPQRLDEILAELMRAVDAGQSIEPDEWLTRYPDFAADLQEYFEKQEQVERLVRPLRQAAAQVLHVRCPHCHNPIELLENARLDEVSCPSCGSSFSLVGEKTVSHYRPGEKTIGHFQLLDRVGIGAFGSVWKARDTQLDRTVAVKIPRNTQLDESQTELFLRDARAAAQLKHPNIVGVHEVGKQDDTIYIVSDFIQGASLKEWLDAKRLTPRETAELCVKIAKALQHAHEAGVIHRDLKPGNIMMDADGEPHIVDFGLAKREAVEITMTIEGQILGTPAYMSPEQARGEGHTVDRRADIYSLGVILFELLTGELPFRGDKQMLIVQIVHDDPPSPRKLNSSVPRDVETICLKCLEKEPFARYATAEALAQELSRFSNGEPIQSRRNSALERLAKWAKRRPALAATGGVAATAIMVTVLTLAVAVIVINSARKSELSAKNIAIEKSRMERDSRLKAERNALTLLFERAYVQCESGDSNDGLLSLALTLEQADTSGFDDLEESIRRHLAAWSHSVYRLRTARQLRGNVSRATFSSGGEQFLVTHGNGARLFNVDTGAQVLELVHQRGGIKGVAISPDGHTLATGSYETTQLWDALTGKPKGSPVELGGTAIAFHPDQETVISCGNRSSWLWELGSGRLLKQLQHTGFMGAVAFSPDGGTVFTSGDSNPAVQLWDVQTGSPIGPPLRDRRSASAVAFSPDGSMVVTGDRVNGYHVRLWEAKTQKQIGPVLPHEGMLIAVAFTSDGKGLVTASYDYRIRHWNTQTGELIGQLEHKEEFDVACVSLGGRYVLTAIGDFIRVWEVPSPSSMLAAVSAQDLTMLPNPLPSADFSSGHKKEGIHSPDGSLVLMVLPGQATAQLYDVRTGKPQGIPLRHYDPISDVAFSPDGHKVITGGDWSARLWDTRTGKPLTPPLRHGSFISDVAISPDGMTALTIAHDGVVKLWEVRTGWQLGPPLRDPSGKTIRTAGFSSDSLYVQTRSGGETNVWKVPRPISGEPKQLTVWAQVLTGLDLDENNVPKLLDPHAWNERRRQIESLGGPPAL